MPERTYEKRRRAEAEAATRRRITEAAVALHGEVGPARTTIADIARRAGVSRVTVYNHFPSDAALLAACSSAWDAAHPGPDPSAWRAIADPDERARVALTELYGFYAANADMLAKVLRDRELLPALDELHRSATDPWIDSMVDALAAGRRLPGRRRGERLAALRLAVDFSTWRVLAATGLDRGAAVDLMTRLLTAVRPPSAPSGPDARSPEGV